MKLKKILITALLSAALYFSGAYLASLYGLDPPYAFYFAGNILIVISYLMMVLTVARALIFCYQFFKSAR